MSVSRPSDWGREELTTRWEDGWDASVSVNCGLEMRFAKRGYRRGLRCGDCWLGAGDGGIALLKLARERDAGV